MPKSKHLGIPGLLAPCCLALTLSACSYLPIVPKEEHYAPQGNAFVTLAVGQTDQLAVGSLNNCLNTWFHAWATSRVIPVPIPEGDPLVFGPWSAAKDYGTSDARDDGSITEWADHYYITHDWSEFGQQILSMAPRDTVTINGRTITIQGIFNYPKASFYEEVMEVVGSDTVVLQTCFPDSDQNRIAYGS